MSFRSALLASAAILTAGTAFAADLPARVAAPAPYIAAPIFTWTGFYVGLNAGAGFNNKASNPLYPNTFVTGGGFGSNGNNDAGFTGGVQAGYNMQFGMFVAGVEADINYLDRGNNGNSYTLSNTYTFNGAQRTDVYTFNRGNSNNWFGTARGRIGIAFDRFLPYLTGGWAFGGKQGGMTASYVTNGVTTAVVSNGDSGSSSGWTLGGGVEYAFSNNMSLKVEYLHVKLGNNDRSFAVVNSNPVQYVTFKNENKFDVVRAGVNWRF